MSRDRITRREFVRDTTTAAAGQQTQVEDLVGAMAAEGKGSLQILSSQALDGFARIYNETGNGTHGQIMDLHLAADGMSEGESGQLLGLRQQGQPADAALGPGVHQAVEEFIRIGARVA